MRKLGSTGCLTFSPVCLAFLSGDSSPNDWHRGHPNLLFSLIRDASDKSSLSPFTVHAAGVQDVSKVFTQTLYLISSWEVIQHHSLMLLPGFWSVCVCVCAWAEWWNGKRGLKTSISQSDIKTAPDHIRAINTSYSAPSNWILMLLFRNICNHLTWCYLSITRSQFTAVARTPPPHPPSPASGCGCSGCSGGPGPDEAEKGSTAVLSLWLPPAPAPPPSPHE